MVEKLGPGFFDLGGKNLGPGFLDLRGKKSCGLQRKGKVGPEVVAHYSQKVRGWSHKKHVSTVVLGPGEE